jgi:hypothetical protein
MPLPRSSAVAGVTAALLLLTACARSAGQASPAPGDTPGTPSERAAREEGAGAIGTQTFIVRGSGVRCAKAPCPFYLASRPGALEGTEPVQVHELDLSALGLSEEEQAALLTEATRGQVTVEGTLVTRPEAGPGGAATVLRVTRVLERP